MSGTLGVRTSSHTSLSARYLPLVAITRILPLPSFEPELQRRGSRASLGRVKAICVDGVAHRREARIGLHLELHAP